MKIITCQKGRKTMSAYQSQGKSRFISKITIQSKLRHTDNTKKITKTKLKSNIGRYMYHEKNLKID